MSNKLFPKVKFKLYCKTTSRNGAFIWDIKKGKMVQRFNEWDVFIASLIV